MGTTSTWLIMVLVSAPALVDPFTETELKESTAPKLVRCVPPRIANASPLPEGRRVEWCERGDGLWDGPALLVEKGEVLAELSFEAGVKRRRTEPRQRLECLWATPARGECTGRYESGKVERRYEVSAQEWKRVGGWSSWHENGQLASRGTFFDGEAEGPFSWWFPSGKLMASATFLHGYPEGRWVEYFENGKKRVEGECLREPGDRSWGSAHGLWRRYEPSGRVCAEERRNRGTHVSGDQLRTQPDCTTSAEYWQASLGGWPREVYSGPRELSEQGRCHTPDE
jgi:antitoxin component YwqK of YwqJK toxin-antitoxin module